MRAVRYGLWLTVLVVFCCRLAHAADGLDIPSSPLRPHTLSLQFGFRGGTPLGTFVGNTISAKYQRSEHAAWRTGLSLDAAARQSDQGDIGYSFDEQTRRTRDLALAVELVRMTYPAPDAPIKPYFGLGPAIAFDRATEDITGYFYDRASDGTLVKVPRASSDWIRTWTLGLSGILGAEWIYRKRIGLHAEYSQNGFYRLIRERNSRVYLGTTTSYQLRKPSWETTSGSLRSGLSVYF